MGWYLDPAFTQPFTGLVGINMNLYARFQRILIANFVTVTFMVNGTVYAELTVPAGTNLFQVVNHVSLSQYYILDEDDILIENASAFELNQDAVFTATMSLGSDAGGGSTAGDTIFPGLADWIFIVSCVGAGVFVILVGGGGYLIGKKS
jgi:hypothetical protein